MLASLSHIIVCSLLSSCCSTFLKLRRVEDVPEPTVVDGKFVQTVITAPCDVLVLLYSPTCPDCEWLIEKVWRKVAAQLNDDPTISVMTIADPGYAAPKPFEHWNNPAIVLAPKGDKLNPIVFPQSRLAEYLKGLPVTLRSQEQQDSDFLQDVLTFAKGAQGVRISQQAAASSKGKGLKAVGALADEEWRALQKKLAGAVDYPAPTSKVVTPNGPKPPRAAFMTSNSGQVAKSHERDSPQLDQDQLWVLSIAQQSANWEKAEAWAVDYAKTFVTAHPGQGYTTEGVFKYALPYYQTASHNGAS